MSAADMVHTFFPGSRKKIMMTAQGTGPLVGKDSQRRIKLALVMDMSDGKLAGMPDWIGQTYSLVAKQGSAAGDSKILVELDGVNVEIYSTDKTAAPSLKLESCLLSSFVVVRGPAKKNGDLPAVELHFVMKTNGWVPKLWHWMADNLNAHFFMTFEGTQMSLSYTGAASTNAEDEEEPDPASDAAIIREADFAKEKEQGTVDPRISKPRNQMSAAQRKAADELAGKKGPTLM